MAKSKKVVAIIKEVEELEIAPELKAEILHDLDDIPEVEEKIEKKLCGLHPVTGVEVWE